MEIDLTKLITNSKSKLELNIEVSYDKDKLKDTSIKELKKVMFKGEIRKLYDGDFQLSGNLTGIMILPDDITLEDVDYDFDVYLEENFNEVEGNALDNLKIIKNKLDISEFLWQNILVEVPLKVVSDKNKNLTLKGNGWRFITEEELQKEKKSPFSEL